MMHRFLALCLGLAGAYLLTGTLGSLPPVQASPGVRPGGRVAQQTVSPCVPEYRKVASPAVLLLGETIDVTLTVKILCAGETFPLHVAFVLDGSGGMAGQPSQVMRQAASLIVRSLDMEDYPFVKAGVVEFNSAAVTRCQLTNSTSRTLSCVHRVGAKGGSAIDQGIDEGARVLRRGRPRQDPDRVTEVMVLLSRGANDEGCEPVLQAARQAKSAGILVIAVCVGPDCNEQCMRQVASSPRYYFRAENAGALKGIFEQIRDRLINIVLRDLEVKDTLPAHMAYVPGSARPIPSQPEEPLDWLLWEDVYIPKDGVTYTYRARPLIAGTMPTNLEARGKLVDNRGRVKEWSFAPPWVTVLEPDPVPMPDSLPVD